MPPKAKQQQQAPKAQGKKANKQQPAAKDDDDALLNELMKQNAQQQNKKGAQNAPRPKTAETLEDRKARHRDRMSSIDRARSEEMEKMLESELKRKQAMERIQELMRTGGMGGFGSPWLNKPKTDIEIEQQPPKNGMATVTGALQGWRQAMEDAHVTNMAFSPKAGQTVGDWGLFAVFDGHAGAGTSKRCRLVLPALVQASIDDASLTESAEKVAGMDFEKQMELQETLPNGVKHLLAPIVPRHFMQDAYLHLDKSMREKDTDSSGSTAVTVMRTDTAYVCASVGDSRAVLVRGTDDALEVVDLSVDHKPEDEKEKERIYAANGTVENNRVNGGLAMSRAIGDYTYKKNPDLKPEAQQVSPMPDVRAARRSDKDRFLIVACDGVFDVFSNVEVSMLVHKLLYVEKKSLEETTREVCRQCVAPEHPEGGRPAMAAGTDNVTLTIVQF